MTDGSGHSSDNFNGNNSDSNGSHALNGEQLPQDFGHDYLNRYEDLRTAFDKNTAEGRENRNLIALALGYDPGHELKDDEVALFHYTHFGSKPNENRVLVVDNHELNAVTQDVQDSNLIQSNLSATNVGVPTASNFSGDNSITSVAIDLSNNLTKRNSETAGDGNQSSSANQNLASNQLADPINGYDYLHDPRNADVLAAFNGPQGEAFKEQVRQFYLSGATTTNANPIPSNFVLTDEMLGVAHYLMFGRYEGRRLDQTALTQGEQQNFTNNYYNQSGTEFIQSLTVEDQNEIRSASKVSMAAGLFSINPDQVTDNHLAFLATLDPEFVSGNRFNKQLLTAEEIANFNNNLTALRSPPTATAGIDGDKYYNDPKNSDVRDAFNGEHGAEYRKIVADYYHVPVEVLTDEMLGVAHYIMFGKKEIENGLRAGNEVNVNHLDPELVSSFTEAFFLSPDEFLQTVTAKYGSDPSLNPDFLKIAASYWGVDVEKLTSAQIALADVFINNRPEAGRLQLTNEVSSDDFHKFKENFYVPPAEYIQYFSGIDSQLSERFSAGSDFRIQISSYFGVAENQLTDAMLVYGDAILSGRLPMNRIAFEDSLSPDLVKRFYENYTLTDQDYLALVSTADAQRIQSLDNLQLIAQYYNKPVSELTAGMIVAADSIMSGHGDLTRRLVLTAAEIQDLQSFYDNFSRHPIGEGFFGVGDRGRTGQDSLYQWLPENVAQKAAASDHGHFLLTSSDQIATLAEILDENSVFEFKEYNVQVDSGDGTYFIPEKTTYLDREDYIAKLRESGTSEVEIANLVKQNERFILRHEVGSGDFYTPPWYGTREEFYSARRIPSDAPLSMLVAFNSSGSGGGDVWLSSSMRKTDIEYTGLYHAIADDVLAERFVQIGDIGPLGDDIEKMLENVFEEAGATTEEQREKVRSAFFYYDERFGILANKDFIKAATDINNNRRQGFFETGLGRAILSIGVTALTMNPTIGLGLGSGAATAVNMAINAAYTIDAGGSFRDVLSGALPSLIIPSDFGISTGLGSVADSAFNFGLSSVARTATGQLISTGQLNFDTLRNNFLGGLVQSYVSQGFNSSEIGMELNDFFGNQIDLGTTAGVLVSQLAVNGRLDTSNLINSISTGVSTANNNALAFNNQFSSQYDDDNNAETNQNVQNYFDPRITLVNRSADEVGHVMSTYLLNGREFTVTTDQTGLALFASVKTADGNSVVIPEQQLNQVATYFTTLMPRDATLGQMVDPTDVRVQPPQNSVGSGLRVTQNDLARFGNFSNSVSNDSSDSSVGGLRPLSYWTANALDRDRADAQLAQATAVNPNATGLIEPDAFFNTVIPPQLDLQQDFLASERQYTNSLIARNVRIDPAIHFSNWFSQNPMDGRVRNYVDQDGINHPILMETAEQKEIRLAALRPDQLANESARLNGTTQLNSRSTSTGIPQTPMDVYRSTLESLSGLSAGDRTVAMNATYTGLLRGITDPNQMVELSFLHQAFQSAQQTAVDPASSRAVLNSPIGYGDRPSTYSIVSSEGLSNAAGNLFDWGKMAFLLSPAGLLYRQLNPEAENFFQQRSVEIQTALEPLRNVTLGGVLGGIVDGTVNYANSVRNRYLANIEDPTYSLLGMLSRDAVDGLILNPISNGLDTLAQPNTGFVRTTGAIVNIGGAAADLFSFGSVRAATTAARVAGTVAEIVSINPLPALTRNLDEISGIRFNQINSTSTFSSYRTQYASASDAATALEAEVRSLGWRNPASYNDGSTTFWDRMATIAENKLVPPTSSYGYHGGSLSILDSVLINGLDSSRSTVAINGGSRLPGVNFAADIETVRSYATTAQVLTNEPAVIFRWPLERPLSIDFIGATNGPVSTRLIEFSRDGGNTWDSVLNYKPVVRSQQTDVVPATWQDALLPNNASEIYRPVDEFGKYKWDVVDPQHDNKIAAVSRAANGIVDPNSLFHGTNSGSLFGLMNGTGLLPAGGLRAQGIVPFGGEGTGWGLRTGGATDNPNTFALSTTTIADLPVAVRYATNADFNVGGWTPELSQARENLVRQSGNSTEVAQIFGYNADLEPLRRVAWNNLTPLQKDFLSNPFPIIYEISPQARSVSEFIPQAIRNDRHHIELLEIGLSGGASISEIKTIFVSSDRLEFMRNFLKEYGHETIEVKDINSLNAISSGMAAAG